MNHLIKTLVIFISVCWTVTEQQTINCTIIDFTAEPLPSNTQMEQVTVMLQWLDQTDAMYNLSFYETMNPSDDITIDNITTPYNVTNLRACTNYTFILTVFDNTNIPCPNNATIMHETALNDSVTVSIVSPSDDPIERTVGNSVTLNCTWDSTAYYFGWYKDGNLVYALDLASSEVLTDTLSVTSSYEGRYSELTIPGSELADSGNYTCVVSCGARDMAFDDIPGTLEDSKEVCFYAVPANITGLEISIPTDDQMPVTAMITWDALSGSDETGISDGCDDAVEYNLTVCNADDTIVHQMTYSDAMATVYSLTSCSNYTAKVMAFNKLQNGWTAQRKFQTVENDPVRVSIDSPSDNPVEMTLGNSVTMNCTWESTAYYVGWYKDGYLVYALDLASSEVLTDTPSVTSSYEGRYSELTIPGSELADSGNYTCVVSCEVRDMAVDDIPEALEDSKEVSFYDVPVNITGLGISIPTDDQMPVTAMITWDAPSGSDQSGISDGCDDRVEYNLTICNADDTIVHQMTYSDAMATVYNLASCSNYIAKVMAFNKLQNGWTAQREFQTVKNDPVTVSIGSPSDDPIERTVGTSVTLNCTWNSTAYYVGWYKDGYLVYAMDLASSEVLNNTLSAASSYEGRYSELTIPGSELADSGNYTCVVSCEVRDMAFDDIPEALEDSKEVSFYDVPVNITGLGISIPTDDQMPVTAMITWDALSGSDQSGISDGCDDTVEYNLTICNADDAIVHQMTYSDAMATVNNLTSCSNYTAKVVAFNKLQNGLTAQREFQTIENDPLTVTIVSPPNDPVERTVGTSVALNCTWNSTAYYVGWYKDGSLVYALDIASGEVLNNTLSATSSYEGRYSELTIPGSNLADSGNYTCVVSCEARDMAVDDIPEALKDSKEVCFYAVPVNITGLGISIPTDDQMPVTAMVTWDALSGSDQSGISDGCADTVEYNLTICNVNDTIVHQMTYSDAMATVYNLTSCSNYTAKVMAFNKLQNGWTAHREFQTIENDPVTVSIDTPSNDPVEMTVGASVTLNCTWNSTTYYVGWYKDGNLVYALDLASSEVLNNTLSATSSYEGRFSELTFPGSSLADSGSYTCVVGCEAKALKDSKEVLFYGVPETVEGLTAKVVEGSPEVNILVQWSRLLPDETGIPVGGNTSLVYTVRVSYMGATTREMAVMESEATFDNLPACENLTISVTASNTLQVSSSAEVGFTTNEMALPTKINISPSSSMSACPKDSLTLTCTSDEPVYYTAWFYNGSPIYGKNLISMTTDIMDDRVSANSTSTSLTIPSVMNEDAGEYICAFSCRTATLDLTQIPMDPREQATVTVKDTSISVAGESSRLYGNGDTIQLECGYSDDLMFIGWWKGGEMIANSPFVMLNISNVSRNNSGVYECRAICTSDFTGVAPEVYMDNVTVTVVEPPSKPMILSCNESIGINTSTIQWSIPTDLGNDLKVNIMYDISILAKPMSPENNISATIPANASGLTRTSHTFTGLQPYTVYCVFVSALNRLRESDASKCQFRTLENEILRIVSNNGTSVSVSRDDSIVLSFSITQAMNPVTPDDIVWTITNSSGTFDLGSGEGDNYVFSEDRLTLRIQRARRVDAGTYSVDASNAVGTASAEITLMVTGVSPQVTTPLRNTTVVEGQSLILTCTAVAEPSPVFVWRFRGERISAIANKYEIVSNNSVSTLTVVGVGGSDEGDYNCSVSNRFGPDSTSAFITILGPPTFLMTPSEIRDVVEGEVLTVECQAIANPPPSIIWMKESSILNIGTSESVQDRVVTNRLVISNLSLSDAGEYSCVAMNEIGNTSSPTFTVNIVVRPTISVIREAFDTVFHDGQLEREEGSTITLQCTASGLPQPSIQWLRNEAILQGDGTRVNVTPTPDLENGGGILNRNSSLHFTRLQLSDAAQYSCRAVSGFVAPIIGQNVWQFDLLVKAFNNCDSGPCQNGGSCIDGINDFTCMCTAFSSGYYAGKTCSEEVIENTPPVITEDPEDKDVALYSSVTLSCVAEGNPEPLIQWYIDDKPSNVFGQAYTISSVQPNDRGFYHCKAISIAFSDIVDSKPALILIKGLIQQTVTIDLSSRRRRQDSEYSSFIEEVNALLSGMELTLQSGNDNLTSEIISVSSLPDAPDNILLVTTVTDTDQSTEIPQLSTLLAAPLQEVVQEASQVINQPFQVSQIVRFDGCPAEETLCGNIGGVYWPETEIGGESRQPCPCGVSSTTFEDLDLVATRECMGDFATGAIWSDPECSNCNLAGVTRALCELVNIDNGAQLASALVTVTDNAEELRTEDVALSADLLEVIPTSEVQGDERVTLDILGTLDQLASAPQESIRASQQSTNSSSRLLDILQTVTENVPLEENGTLQFFGESFGLQVQAVMVDPETPLVPDLSSIADSIANNSNMRPPLANIALPGSAIPNSTALRVSAALYTNATLFQQSSSSLLFSNETEVGSVVVSLSIFGNGQEISDLEEAVTITLGIMNQGYFPRCAFWNFSLDRNFGAWDNSGCDLVNSTNNYIVCECDHLTNFAILLDIFPDVPGPTDDLTLQNQFLTAVSYIGTSISIICLILTIVTYLADKTLRQGIHRQLLINLCVALTGLYATFIVSTFSMAVWQWCIVISALMQYFFLATFFWMTAEAINLYRKLVQVFKPDIKNYIAIAMATCWVVPVFIVAFSLAPRYQNYFHQNFCRVYDYSFYFGVIIPFGLVYIFNWVTFILIMVSLSSRPNLKKEGSKKANYRKLKENLWVAMGLSVLIGLGWGIGLLATTGLPSFIHIIFEWAFTIMTAFQGLIIFILYCLRAAEARKVWKRILCCESRRHKHSLEPSSSGWTGTLATKITTLGRRTSQSLAKRFTTKKTFISGSTETGQIISNPSIQEIKTEPSSFKFVSEQTSSHQSHQDSQQFLFQSVDMHLQPTATEKGNAVAQKDLCSFDEDIQIQVEDPM